MSVLESIVSNDLNTYIHDVIIGKDKNVNNDFSKDIANLCKSNNISFSYRDSDVGLTSDYNIAVSWRWFEKTNNKIITLHDSMLPELRGFAPVVNSLILGKSYLGVTAFEANDKIDQGPILLQEKVDISYPIKVQEAIEKIIPLYQTIACKIVKAIGSGQQMNTYTQDESHASFSMWRDEEDYQINWNDSAENIRRFIDAVGHPYKGAKSTINGKTFRILNAAEIADCNIVNRTPGKVFQIENGLPTVVCAKGLLQIQTMIDEDGNSALPFKKLRTRFS